MSLFFVDRPIFATVLAILITLAGAIALTQLPVARYPQITPPTVVVSTSFPGADAATVAQSVAAPIEQQVNGVPNMLYMSSKSANDGSYSLTVTFDVGTDQDIAAVQVQNQVAIAQRFLPQEVLRQGVTITRRQPQVLMLVGLRSTDPRYDYLFISNYATLQLTDALARVPGVGQVNVFGSRDYGMRIWLDPAKMARLGVTSQDVSAVINEQNLVAPAGRIGAEPAPKGQQLQYTVRVQGRLSEPRQYENMIVRARDDGTLVRLRDIARIELGATDYSRSSRLNGEPIAMMGIYQLPDANALEVAERVRATMDELSKSFPQGLEYAVPFDTTLFVDESIHEVILTLAIAALLVLLVIFFFLESWRATLIPMLAVPVSLIGSFVVFALLGFSINTLTLFAMVLAIGLVVDDAIVVVEAVTEKMDAHGHSAREATRAALRDVAAPVIAIALVLTAVFVPVAFLGGLTGQFYRQFALTLSVSVLISAFVALSFTPALCVLLLRPTADSRWRGPLGRFFNAFNRGFERFTQRYTDQVRLLLRRSLLAVLLFVIVGVATAAMVKLRPVSFIPEEDQGYLLLTATLPAAASLQRTEAVMKRAREIALSVEGVDKFVAITGFSPLVGVSSSYVGFAFVTLKSWAKRGQARSANVILEELLARANREIKEASFLLLNPPPVPGIGQAGGFEFVLQNRSGASMPAFQAVLQDVLARAAKRPEIGRAFTQFNAGVPQYEYLIDRERAKTLGVPVAQVFAALQTFLGGSYVNDFNLYGRTYRVTVQAEGHSRARVEDALQLHVRSDDGAMVPLSALMSIRPTAGPEYIERLNVFPAVNINGSAAPGYSSGDAIRAMEEIGADLPAGYGYDWIGTTFQQKKSGGQAPFIFGLALLFVFLVLAAQYESWAVPFAVILGIPFAVFGAFIGLAARGMANDIFAQVGLVMLIGLAAKNAILIVEFAQLAQRRGRSIVEAAVEGARLRLRPILMTSFAFILGALPLALASGAGAGARQVLGTVVVFGMTAATLIGIFLVPVFYVLIQTQAERFRHRRRGRPASSSTGIVT
jgi:hydrophobe/amphiphile efflux-1 (HAE1) family protein